MLYSIGDVVKAYFKYRNPDNTIYAILRPVIIKEIKGDQYVIVKISRSNKVQGLIRVVVNSPEWEEMGLYDEMHDSFIDKKTVDTVSEASIDRKLGRCPIIVFSQL